jgi:hypothetical protein
MPKFCYPSAFTLFLYCLLKIYCKFFFTLSIGTNKGIGKKKGQIVVKKNLCYSILERKQMEPTMLCL